MPTSIETTLPHAVTLDQNYPNPFNPTTNISFTLAEGSHTTLEVFDLLGQKVATLIDETLPAGQHNTAFTPADLPSGIYFYRLRAGQEVRSRTLTLLK
ncbi:MAG: T9SS type A sorting domain-containing protein [Bacteroidota bacterium]